MGVGGAKSVVQVAAVLLLIICLGVGQVRVVCDQDEPMPPCVTGCEEEYLSCTKKCVNDSGTDTLLETCLLGCEDGGFNCTDTCANIDDPIPPPRPSPIT
jgi:hypothetical protein